LTVFAMTALAASGSGAAARAQDAQAPARTRADTDSQSPKPPAVVVTTDPNLTVATVRLEGGYRASKVVGAAVYNAENQQIGTVDDIVLNHQNQADLVVISVGGFLGVGGKLVALPYGKIERTDSAKVVLADGSKDTLAKMPNFTYAP
jgi:sporulation protein YlmC with PRC-barrel domain